MQLAIISFIAINQWLWLVAVIRLLKKPYILQILPLEVHLIHRRDTFRAEKILIDRLNKKRKKENYPAYEPHF